MGVMGNIIKSFIFLIVLWQVVKLIFGLIFTYFEWLEKKTGYNPSNKSNLVFLALSIILPLIHIIITNAPALSTLDYILFVIPLVIVFVRNITNLKNPLHIIIVSLIQAPLGIILVIWGIINILGGGDSPRTVVQDNSSYDDTNQTNTNVWVEQSWAGNEYDTHRANQMGFNSVDDAKNAGYDYNGNKS